MLRRMTVQAAQPNWLGCAPTRCRLRPLGERADARHAADRVAGVEVLDMADDLIPTALHRLVAGPAHMRRDDRVGPREDRPEWVAGDRRLRRQTVEADAREQAFIE